MWGKIFRVVLRITIFGNPLWYDSKGGRSYEVLIVLSEATYPFRRTKLNFLHCAKIRFSTLTRTAFSSYYLRTTKNTRGTYKCLVSYTHCVCPTNNNVFQVWKYRVARKLVNLKHPLALTGMLRFKSVIQFAERYHSVMTCALNLNDLFSIFFCEFSNKGISKICLCKFY